jgi:polynucleotide 5'-hydroxyl-kinase GRC3/NOL9
LNKLLSKGRTVLISGPASVVLTNGNVAALGFQLPLRKKIIIRKNKAIPFEAEEDSTLEIVLSDDASIEEIDGSTIPGSWKATVESILKLPKPCTVLVIGDVDCGKNAFCICLVNYALASGLKPTVIDADIGQSEIGPPTAVGSTSVSEQTLDFFSLNAEHVFFVGLTSPSGATDRTIDGIASIKRHISGTLTHLVVVNTDGWIKEEIARQYKSKLIRALGPEAIVAIQNTDELEQILAVASETSKVFRVTSPQVKGRRGKETRKELREQGYRKYLEGATTRRLPMKWVRFELTTFGSGTPLTPSKLRELEEVLGYRTLYCEENPKELLVVTDEAYAMNVEQVENVKKCFGKALRIIGEGDLTGLLIGLFDERRRFLGLGVIDRIDCKNRILKIMTPCKEKVDIVQFGQVKVDKLGREIGYATALSD